jgi:hypothetical protein
VHTRAGKTGVVERSNKMNGGGYSAIYFYNSSGEYQLASAVLRLPGGGMAVDVDMPHKQWYAAECSHRLCGAQL